MSDPIKHECGVVLIRLLKPLQYYIDKYGTPLYGINKLYLMMEKQRNRGQDGAGVGAIKFRSQSGKPYIFRKRSVRRDALGDIFSGINSHFKNARSKHGSEILRNGEWIGENVPFAGELLLGHLRYGTHGENSIHSCHPFMRQNNWMCRNLVLAGNFNMTNNDQLISKLIELGQHPRNKSDTVTVLEKVGHFLDEENERLFRKYKNEGFSRMEITGLIAENLSMVNVLKNSARDFDGGYVLAGMIGHGDAFVLRDPSGIRPVFYYADDEVLVVASERPAIQTAFNVSLEKVKQIGNGNALLIKRNGNYQEANILKPLEPKSCSFERIYFSRGTDADIYKERKALGRYLTEGVLKAVNYKIDDVVFSYIPNTAEMAFLGLVEGLNDYLDKSKKELILEKGSDLKEIDLINILNAKARVEKIAVKDVKMRTFIADDENRSSLVSHVYDVSYGVVRPGKDKLVILDDSIVRGTTLQTSILNILDRLGPKEVIVVSSAPQIRYPDCYGIDMSKLSDFVAFRALISLIKENAKEDLLEKVYYDCKDSVKYTADRQENHLKKLYKLFTVEEISDRIAQIVRPVNMKAKVQVIYQTIENLHASCPDHKGDWYFTGNFPTPGGNKVVNKAFMNYFEKLDVRAY